MFLKKTNLGCFPKKYYSNNSKLQDRRKSMGGIEGASSQHHHHFLEQKNFFYVKSESENIKFLHVNNMRDFSLFIEQDISNKN